MGKTEQQGNLLLDDWETGEPVDYSFLPRKTGAFGGSEEVKDTFIESLKKLTFDGDPKEVLSSIAGQLCVTVGKGENLQGESAITRYTGLEAWTLELILDEEVWARKNRTVALFKNLPAGMLLDPATLSDRVGELRTRQMIDVANQNPDCGLFNRVLLARMSGFWFYTNGTDEKVKKRILDFISTIPSECNLVCGETLEGNHPAAARHFRDFKNHLDPLFSGSPAESDNVIYSVRKLSEQQKSG